MVVFGCLICKEAFFPDEYYRENKSEEKHTPVLTSCGHYFHLPCIQAAFVHEKMNSPDTGTRSKSCPFSKCGRNLHNTSLIKIHPEEIHFDSSKKKVADIQSELQYWKRCVENSASFEAGDKVVYNTGNGNQTGLGTVKQIMVEVQLENGDVSSGPASNHAAPWKDTLAEKLIRKIHGPANDGNESTSIVLPKNKVKLAPSMSQIRSEMKSVAIKLETQANGVRKAVKVNNPAGPRKYPAPEEISDLRPKWEAGDRIYLTNEKEYATIKWIGSRNYTFIVVIEYDHEVGDKGIQTDDLPFLIKDGFGRRFTIEQLNETARKVSHNSASRIFAQIHRWGSERIRNGTPRPTILHMGNSTPINNNNNA